MVRIIDAANYLFNEYKSISGGSLLDEMKLHKLLYLAQRKPCNFRTTSFL